MSLLPVGIGGARSGGYEIEKSLRFRASASAYLGRPFGSGNRKTWTWSGWVKRGSLGAAQGLMSTTGGVTASRLYFAFFNADVIGMSSDTVNYFTGTRVLRDPAAWYHIVVVCDTTNATAADRVKVFVNGQRDTRASGSNFSLNEDTAINTNTLTHHIGRRGWAADLHFDGYMSEINFIDGQALDPSYFGKTDPATGQWVPKKYVGSYGTNGFYLDFKDGTSLTTLGYDKSGNGNNWTLNNFSLTPGVTYDWMEDTPSNTFCTMNQLEPSLVALSNGSLTGAYSSTWKSAVGSIAGATGKWYWEIQMTGVSSSMFGIAAPGTLLGTYFGFYSTGYGYQSNNGNIVNNNASLGTGATYTTNDIVGVAYDASAGTLEFFKNGVTQVSLTSVPAGMLPACALNGSGSSFAANFGQRPFAYTPPAGFKALCTKNLPAPQVKNGAGYFDVVLDSGASIKTACEALYGSFFEWIKDRANTNNHQLIDSVRGNTAVLQSNTANDETTYSAPSGSSVGWVWRIAAGFLDVVTYTGTGVARTVAHNLGVAPAMVVVKARTTAGADQGWAVYHQSNTAAPETDYLLLNSTAATADLDTVWNDTPPTSSELTVGTDALVNASGDDYVAWLFAEVDGFSKFGSYTGSGSANGPFVYCGFKPKFLMIKCSSTTGDWWVYDAERSPANPAILKLLANTNGVEDVAGEDVDLLSNGFKIRSTAAGQNTNAATYVFAAFAECPFSVATAR